MTTEKSLKSIDRVMEHTEGNVKKDIKFIELAQDYYYVKGFANVGIIMTSEGVVVIDTTVSNNHAENIYGAIREKTDLPIKYIIYTHGHLDHVNSTHVFKEEQTKVIAHENVNERFIKYQSLEDYHLRINGVQFQNKLGLRSFDFITPDITFHQDHKFQLGNKNIRIFHGKGETDDHCFIHVPEDDVVYCGDFFVWSFPNIGNPLKVIRYEREWYETLEKIKQLEPEILIPGHGKAITGKDQIKSALQDVIDTLKFVHEEVTAHINKGTHLENALELIQLPEHLENSPYVKQTYGCLEFAIKGIYRRYTGWFDGNPTHLSPAKQEDVAAEINSLVQDPQVILKRCRSLMDEGKYQMALHLSDILVLSQDDEEAKALKKEAIEKQAETNQNFIMRNIYKQLM
ncbi:MBL fold metallo-hydrolase [Salicibibacter cibi]|uniref:MBL fold metallo-hydrolase n=1 Tax=Salicibibacter cibi TaxID=2743001 RepID=A0A7T6ZBK3_9BACI|nr:alkyl sulfatase dimerization domain-containing protein [Salicibibacter cibi]QQK80503.1 MBL fold metallo-hydrolase [Salicibibacter cibi]QQK80506.1 MBL fold metallo-hydrolase [Salicibibacter cibi]